MTPDRPPSFTQSDLFGGTGSVDIWNLRQVLCPPFSAVLWCSLEANGDVGRHRQQDDPEIVIGVSGEGVAQVGGNEHHLICGSMVYLPLGQALSIRNTHPTTPLVYLIIKAQTP